MKGRDLAHGSEPVILATRPPLDRRRARGSVELVLGGNRRERVVRCRRSGRARRRVLQPSRVVSTLVRSATGGRRTRGISSSTRPCSSPVTAARADELPRGHRRATDLSVPGGVNTQIRGQALALRALGPRSDNGPRPVHWRTATTLGRAVLISRRHGVGAWRRSRLRRGGPAPARPFDVIHVLSR
jgi:hypothetical protein